MELLIFLVVSTAFIIPILVVVNLAHRQEQERRKVYQHWAAQYPGWTYRIGYDRELYRHYRFLEPLRGGWEGNAIQDVFEGRWRNYISKAFTFHYTRTSSSGPHGTQTTSHYYLGVVLIQVHGVFPHLSIRPAGLLHKIGLHRNPIVSPSEEFDQKFVVKTTDQQFARHFCHEAMMQYFLQSPEIQFEINQDVFVIYQRDRLKVSSIEPCLEQLHRICQIGLLDEVESYH